MAPLVEAASSLAVCSTTSARRPHMYPLAPSCRKRSASERPMPVPPPVTRKRLPLRRSAVNMRAPFERVKVAQACVGCSDREVLQRIESQSQPFVSVDMCAKTGTPRSPYLAGGRRRFFDDVQAALGLGESCPTAG